MSTAAKFCSSAAGGSLAVAQVSSLSSTPGRVRPGHQRWVFGGLELALNPGSQGGGHATGRVFLEPVPDRRAPTLLAALQRHVSPGSVLWSDEWRGYAPFRQAGYTRLSVNHARGQWRGAHGQSTNAIEGFWARMKRHIRARGGFRELVSLKLDGAGPN